MAGLKNVYLFWERGTGSAFPRFDCGVVTVDRDPLVGVCGGRYAAS